MTSKTSKIIKIAVAVTLVAIVCAVIGIYLSRVSAEQTDTRQRTIWDGVYTKAQAQRGAKLYNDKCGSCHGADLDGNGDLASALAGDEFLADWYGQTASDLFIRTQNTMPGDNPGSLNDASDADLLAYIFSVNNFPAGARELPRDARRLGLIEIQPAKSTNN